MAFAYEEFSPSRWWDLHAAQTHATAGNSAVAMTAAISVRWRIADVRFHFSTAVASAITLLVKISSALGSEYNVTLLSQALLGVQDLYIHYSVPVHFNSDDVIGITTNASIIIANMLATEIWGWAVRG